MFDDGGISQYPVTVRLKANGVALNSGDLEDGNDAKGLPEGLSPGKSDWRLEFERER